MVKRWTLRTRRPGSSASEKRSSLSPKSSDLGDLLQWLAGADPEYLKELEQLARRHVTRLLRNRAKTARRRSDKKRWKRP
jgi:hypothetical protein